METDTHPYPIIRLKSYHSLMAIALLCGITNTAIAQTHVAKYGGSSKYWKPDYAGTVQIRESGTKNFTATLDVELQQKPDIDPNPTSVKYELRGQMTFTSPIVVKTGTSVVTCTPISPVPLSIADSGMTLYTGAGGNRYKIRAYQYIRTSKCVASDGGRVVELAESRAGELMGFDSNAHGITAKEQEMMSDARDFTISEADRQKLERMGQNNEAVFNHPAVQQEMARMDQEEAEFQRTGKRPDQAAQIARMQKLAESGAFSSVPTGGLSGTSPEFQQQVAKMSQQSQKISQEEEARLIKAPDLNRLQGGMNAEVGLENYKTRQEASWNLRRVK
jgi:hypothetical protein